MKSFRVKKILITTFMSAMVAVSLSTGNIYLSIVGISIGLLFLMLVRYRSREVVVDERVEHLAGKAARLSYSITTVFISFLALFFLYIGRRTSEVYLESLGTVFCYIVCLSVGVYAMTYKYLDRKHGGDN